MEKRAVVTMCTGPLYERVAEVSHPGLVNYAKKIKADFIVWKNTESHSHWDFQKCELRPLLETYDRVVYIDTDINIRADAPDIFDIVPEDRLGLFEESRYIHRTPWMKHFLKLLNVKNAKFNGRYFNIGVIVASKMHSEIFRTPEREVVFWGAQSWFNFVFSHNNIPMFSLPPQWNRMPLLDLVLDKSRFESFFIHYAALSSILGEENFLHLMKSDQEILKEAYPYYDFKRLPAKRRTGRLLPIESNAIWEPAKKNIILTRAQAA